ncbi:MAG: M48 family metalloprotease [Alphaproteobacteria bacterium]|nr:M48 family metalloprotease [Alphaproteobacteria bacterium]
MVPLLFLGFAASAQNAFADLVSTHALTASDDYRIGASYVELSGWLYGKIDDPAIVRRVEGVTRRVLAASDRPDLVVNVIVSDSPEINASAYPGGFLVVNRGAVELFDDEELTFVLAHEISHVLLRHYATTENLRMATETLSVAETAMNAADRGQAEAAAMEIERMMARYGRQLEFEADLYGQLYTVRAGVPAAAAERAMKKLHEAVGPIPEEMKDIANHPSFEDRIAELGRGRAAMETTHRKFDVGLSALSAGLDEMAVEAFQEFLTLFPKSVAGWSNLAAAHLEQGLAEANDTWVDRVPVRIRNDVTLRAGGSIHMDRARDACSKALAIDPNAPECLVMLGVMARHAERLDEARTFLTRADALSSGADAAVLVDLGIVEAASGDAAAAKKRFDAALAADPGNPHARANLAVLAEQGGDAKAAAALWKALLTEGRMTDRARAALTRLGAPAEAPVSGDALALGSLALGMDPKAVRGVLGNPSVEDGDDIGLNVYWLWTDKGVSALFSADAVVGLECWTPCDLAVKGVSVGKPFDAVQGALGAPSDLVSDPLYGLDRTAYYDRLGLTFYEQSGKVGRIALWER